MGIRKHLKTTLGLLAVGSVAFAGAAFAADNQVNVKQDAKTGKAYMLKDGVDLNNATVNSDKFEIEGTGNVLFVKETGSTVILQGHQTGGNNKVGVETDTNDDNDTTNDTFITLESKDDNNSYGKINFQLKQAGGDKVLAVTGETANGESATGTIKSVSANEIDLTIDQDQNAGSNASSTVNLGYIKLNDSNSSDVNKITIEQSAAGAVASLNSLETTDGKMDFYLKQSGTGATAQFGDVKSSTNVIQGESIRASVDQSAANASLTIHHMVAGDAIQIGGYNDVANGSLIQSGADNDGDGSTDTITVNSMDATNGYIHFGVSQTGDNDTITIDSVTADANDIDFNVQQSDDNDEVTVDTIHASNSVDVDINQDKQNKIHIDEIYAGAGNANVTVVMDNVDSPTSYNEIGGISGTSDADNLAFSYSNGLYQHATAGSVITTIEVHGEKNKVGLHQEASTDATAIINIGSDNSQVKDNTVLVYQDAGSGRAYANIDVDTASNIIKLYQKASGGAAEANIVVQSHSVNLSITQTAATGDLSLVKVY